MNSKKGLLLAVALMAAAAGCASGAAKPGAGVTNSANACSIDAQQICEQGKNLHASTDPTGYSDSQSQVEQNGPPTQDWTYTFETPDHTTLQVQCEYNLQHHRVIYAHALNGPTLTESDVSYLKAQGLCTDSK